MELTETIDSLNRQLIDEFGIDTVTGDPIFRIVWANDQTEKALVDTLDSGIQLLFPEVRTVKKYPFFKNLYVLERLVVIPTINEADLPASKLSYEPVWTYCDEHRQYLPPMWPATKFVVDTLYAALGKKSLAKYKEDEKFTTPEGRDERINELQEELFGNETDTGDALAHNQAIVVPRNYNKES